jgi:hypothetical protein
MLGRIHEQALIFSRWDRRCYPRGLGRKVLSFFTLRKHHIPVFGGVAGLDELAFDCSQVRENLLDEPSTVPVIETLPEVPSLA